MSRSLGHKGGSTIHWLGEQLRICLPVEAVFEDHTPEITLVQWRPRRGD